MLPADMLFKGVVEAMASSVFIGESKIHAAVLDTKRRPQMPS